MPSKWITMLGLATCVLLPAQSIAASKAADKTTHAKAERTSWPTETLSGTIMMTDPGQKLLIVQTKGGTPFDFEVTPATRIESNGQTLTFQDLANDTNKNISVRFVPERKGDVARSVHLTS